MEWIFVRNYEGTESLQEMNGNQAVTEALRRDKRGLQAMLKNWKKNLLWLLMAVSLMLCACGQVEIIIGDGSGYDSSTQNGSQLSGAGNRSQTSVSLDSIPEYSGDPYVVVNNNVPFFSKEDLEAEVFENYGDLDSLGRCTVAYSMVGTETMPTQERGNIGQVKPTGWHAVKYDNVDGKYLYNRCHLIGYQLTAENANVNNLITGTRYLNVQGMLPFENLTADYIKETGNHVLYRVTPVFEGDDLVASGVLMEGESAEDGGEAIQFCVYVYNVQPGIIIDYATGDSRLDDGTGGSFGSARKTYVLNTNSKTFHKPDCGSVGKIKDSNKQTFVGTREEAIKNGYSPCKSCNP